MDTIASFLRDCLPSIPELLIGGPLSLLWAYGSLAFAGYLKQRKGWRTGYTRKTFHFLTFGSAAALHLLGGLALVCLFGLMTSLVIAYALLRGTGHPLYEAMARASDAPRRTYYIIVPYFATLLGGLLSNLLFGQLAVIGYLVGGLGDAVGEPVGTRWGRHRYAAPSFGVVKTFRSYEGSLGVLLVSGLALALGIALLPDLQFRAQSFLWVPLLGLASALLEAVSPHGWDNTTMQIVPTLLAALVL